MRKFVGGFSNDAIKLVIHLVDSKGKTPSPLLWTSDLCHRCVFHVGVRVQQPCAACPQSQLFSRAMQSLLKVWALPRYGVAAFVQILTRLNVQFLNAATWTCFSVSHYGVRVVLDLCRRGKSKIILCSFSYPPPPCQIQRGDRITLKWKNICKHDFSFFWHRLSWESFSVNFMSMFSFPELVSTMVWSLRRFFLFVFALSLASGGRRIL